MYTLTIEDTPRSEDVQRLAQGLTAHALPYTQVPGFAPLGVFLKDEHGALVGGVYRNPRTGGIRSTSSMTQLQPSQDHGAPLLHDLTIVPFRPEHQANVKRLILAGLTEHWGQRDPTKNPDLNDIAATYAHATFLVAWWHGTIVGTGALLPPSQRIVLRLSAYLWPPICDATGSADACSSTSWHTRKRGGIGTSSSKRPRPGMA